VQHCSINDERCHTSEGTNLDGVSKQKSQALNQVGLAGACSACDNEPQWIGNVASEVVLPVMYTSSCVPCSFLDWHLW